MERISFDFPFISVSIAIPFVFSVLILIFREAFAKYIALLGTGLVFLLSLIALTWFDFGKTEAVQFYEEYTILGELGVKLSLGMDGFSLLMYLLTTLVSLVAVVWSMGDEKIKHRLKEYYIAFLLTEAFVIGVFTSFDLIVFYVFYELTLLPMLFVIGVWGYKLRLYSAYKFFVYIFISSLFLLLGIASLSVYHYKEKGSFTFSYFELLGLNIPNGFEIFLFLLFFIAFAVKTPIVPFHTWLPDAHGEAPTAGSVVLAAILLKMGTYALVRFNIGLFPDAAKALAPYLVALGIYSIIMASWMTISQTNIKRFVAYSSVSHMGFVVTAMFLLTMEGLRASIIEMFAHGLTSAGLFMVAGFIYNRLHTFNFASLRGAIKFMPLFATITAAIAFAAMGLPGGSSFWGKFLTVVAAREYSTALALIVIVAAFFSGAYVLYFMKTLYLDVREESVLVHFRDVSGYPLVAFLMILAPVLVVGLAPFVFFAFYEGVIQYIVRYILRLPF
ncbi:MAG: NuoM family protein [Aquificae bacterium]|nr:NuoM family protein [Aquificota bacterium]